MKRKFVVGLGGTIVAILLSAVFGPYWFALEGVLTDWRFKLKEPPQLSKKIKIFKIDVKSFQRKNDQKKIVFYDSLVKELINQGARTVSISISEDGYGNNLEWLKKNPKIRVVLSIRQPTFNRLNEMEGDRDSLGKASGFVQVSSFVNFLSLGQKSMLVKGITLEKDHLTHSRVYADVFGKVRKIPLWVESGKKLIPAFAMESWLSHLNVENPEIKILSSRVELNDEVVKASIPTDMNVMTLIEVPKGFEETILQAKEDQKSISEIVSKVGVKDNLVFVSFYASDKVLEERDSFISQVALTNSLLQESFLKEAHKSTVHSLSLLLSFLAVVFVSSSKGKKKYLGIVFLTSSYLLINILFFNRGLILPILLPVMAMMLSALAEGRFIARKTK
jgi:hypothetical protein